MPVILVVDDDDSFLNGAERDLRDIADVRSAKTGLEALELLERDSAINLALIDIKMPIMNGIELLKQMKKKFPRIGAIIVTANGMTAGEWDNVNECRKVGIYSFVEKPYDPSVLKALIRKALERHPKYLRLLESFNKHVFLNKANESTEISLEDGFLDQLGDEIITLADSSAQLILDMKKVRFVAEPGLIVLMKLRMKGNTKTINVSANVRKELDICCETAKLSAMEE